MGDRQPDVPRRSIGASIPVADRLSEVDDLIHRADLDGLVRMVDSLCADDDWQSLLELRNRSRAAVVTGRQLWPAATLAEYRLALWAPAEWAAHVLDEDSGRFTIGPLTEVVAQRHEFADLRAALPRGPRLGFIAHECAFRGQLVATDLANPLEIPFELQPWEPAVLPGRVQRRWNRCTRTAAARRRRNSWRCRRAAPR